MIQRILLQKIQKDLRLKKAIIILGARQVGKTTLLNEIAKSYSKIKVITDEAGRRFPFWPTRKRRE